MEERFVSKIDKTDKCWNWRGSVLNGYGVFWKETNNRPAHRIAYELWKGTIPENNVVRHLCFNPLCVNPEHLDVGTQKENIMDSVKAKRHQHRETHWGSIHFSQEDLETIKNSDKSQRKLAKEYGVSQGTISKIKLNRHWLLIQPTSSES
jgi:hypothetical protein